ncbi:hypothetical protein C8R43DRAFT_283339 [Mycena crocata]|nr:hypothetical protein C8R43DRAFT_283339 [Mycena crocata]
MFPSTTSYMKPADRVRRQWHAFEQWVETVPRVAMEQAILEASKENDAKWNATPTRTRPSKQDHEKNKATYRRELEDGLVTLAREEWQRRLEQAGLRDEDWGDMTFKETLAVERLLGGDLDEEGMAIMESVARAEDSEVAGLPALKHAVRTSGYSFVSPMSLNIGDELDDDDDTDAFESIYPFETPASSRPESIADEIFDTPTSIPWGWNGDSSSYGIWSADTSQSSRQSSQTGSPERPPPKTIAAEHTFFPRAAAPLPPFEPDVRSASHKTRVAGPRYIGPQLTDAGEMSDDEADFERFKMETRVVKIREFHEEAARADIQLAQDIYNARKTSKTWRDDEERKISEHEKRMVELRRSKEEERKEIVREERQKRREAIRQRQTRNVPGAWGEAESPRQRLTQEVESKLKLGSGFIVTPDPVVPLPETRRDRRHSQSTLTPSQSALFRSAWSAAPESDRLTASVPDLLDVSVSTTPVSTASSTTSSSAASSQPPADLPQVWVPPAEVVKAAAPTKGGRKKNKSTSSSVETAVFSAVSPTAVSKLPSPSPAVNKPVVSNANSSKKTAAKGQSPAAAKVQSPPAPVKVTPPPAPAKAPPPPAPAKASSPPAPAKGQTPPVLAKGQSPAAPAKGPSPPAPSKGPSPPAPSKGPSPPALSKTYPPVKSPPGPPVDTPKPTPPITSPPTIAQKMARAQVIDTPTPGASSSRTTLEQIQRPFIHKSLGSDLWMPPPPPPSATVWVSSSSVAKKADQAKMSLSSSTQIEKSTSMPPRLPVLAESRPRRMSDPVSPSPRSFAFPEKGGVKMTPGAPPSILKKSKAGKQGKAKRVTIEEVSDEEDADSLERLPVDSKVIFEPKPSVPPTTFSHILDFTPTSPPPSAPVSTMPSRSSNLPAGSKGNVESSDFLTADGKMAKEKHVRWTPSTAGTGENQELRAALEALETNVLSPPSGAKKGLRSRTGSLVQTGTVDRKGKGKARAVEPEPEDDFARFMIGATQDLTQLRN